jgi:hypothetical protein
MFSTVLFSVVITSVRLVTLIKLFCPGKDAVSFYTVILAIVRFGKILMELLGNTVRLEVTVKFGVGSNNKRLFGM